MLEKIFFGGEKSPSAPSKRFIVVSELDPRPMLDLRQTACWRTSLYRPIAAA